MSVLQRVERAGGIAAPVRPSPLRVLIVDDSLVARTVLARLLSARDEFKVVGTAPGAAAAMALLARTTVDLILLDVEMPGTCGLTALPELLAQSRGARVLIVSSQSDQGSEASVRALTLGAADTLLKPTAADFGDRFADMLAETMLRIASGPAPRSAAVAVPRTLGAVRRDPVACLAIGASTGGPHALATFFAALPVAFDAPILVTQHLPASFMPFFAEQLREISGRDVTVARGGARLERGGVLVAPGEGHLTVARHTAIARAELDFTPAPSGCCPSVDPMLASVARVYGAQAAAVVLTGMGRDGLAGAGAVAAAGGEVLAQDSGSSVVWGMPGVVANAGLAALVAPPAALAERVAQRGAC